MIRIGLVSAATYGYMDAPRTPGSFHGTAFSTVFNGYDPDKAGQYEWTFAAASRRLEGARVVKVWDPHIEWAERLADVCSIPQVCQTHEECSEDVDAVVVVDDGSTEQAQLARVALRKGLPTFIDKPIALTAKSAQQIVDIARQNEAPLMSASSLRYVPDVVRLASQACELGPVHLSMSICGNDLVYYGIHALETAYAVLGAGAVSCLNVGQPGRNIVRVRFQSGRDHLLMVGESDYMRAGFGIGVYGKNGWQWVQPDLTDLYVYLMQQFLDMVNQGTKEVVPLDEIVEVIAVLQAGKLSLEEGREVEVREMLE